MSKASRDFFEKIKTGAGKVWDEIAHPFAHGAHEVAATLFHGNAFVMYPRAGEGKEDPQKEGQQEQQQEQERGGREM